MRNGSIFPYFWNILNQTQGSVSYKFLQVIYKNGKNQKDVEVCAGWLWVIFNLPRGETLHIKRRVCRMAPKELMLGYQQNFKMKKQRQKTLKFVKTYNNIGMISL